jgi:hypothetical protein
MEDYHTICKNFFEQYPPEVWRDVHGGPIYQDCICAYSLGMRRAQDNKSGFESDPEFDLEKFIKVFDAEKAKLEFT